MSKESKALLREELDKLRDSLAAQVQSTSRLHDAMGYTASKAFQDGWNERDRIAEEDISEERARSARLLEVLKCYANESLSVTVTEEIGDGPMSGWVQCDDGELARQAIADYNQSEGGEK